MNAIARDATLHAVPSAARSGDHLGATVVGPSEIAYHTVLSSLTTGGDLSFADSTLPAGTSVPPHRHPEEDQLLIVLAGSVELSVAGRTLLRGPGQSAFVPRGTDHGIRAVGAARIVTILTRTSLEAPSV